MVSKRYVAAALVAASFWMAAPMAVYAQSPASPKDDYCKTPLTDEQKQNEALVFEKGLVCFYHAKVGEMNDSLSKMADKLSDAVESLKKKQ